MLKLNFKAPKKIQEVWTLTQIGSEYNVKLSKLIKNLLHMFSRRGKNEKIK